jgi:ABC-2 type transport system permease protein
VVGAASIMSAVFVLARTAMLFTNALGYPFYLLGGVLVPAAFLPGWLQPVSRLVFLSWSSDLLRDSLSTAPLHDLAPRAAVIAGLGLLQCGAALVLMRALVRRASLTGSLGLR